MNKIAASKIAAPGRSRIELEVDVEIVAGDWRMAAAGVESLCVDAARAAVRARLGCTTVTAELGIRLTDDSEQRRLNAAYRGKPSSTNVLSFPQLEEIATISGDGPASMLGDVVLAFETVRRESDEQDKEFANHLRHLIVHGVLHLLGCDHIDEDGAAAMETLETQILAALGVTDPYADRTDSR